MERPELAPGTVGSASMVVAERDTAAAMALEPGDSFPAVFATTRMIGLMELAAGRAMRPLLRDGELSVGFGVDVKHTAPTPVGATVTAEAVFVAREGKLYVFEVVARDPGGEIGRGRHVRAIVEEARLLAGAARRI
jgi:fluoroacetyl-CoA thioesterase